MGSVQVDALDVFPSAAKIVPLETRLEAGDNAVRIDKILYLGGER
jgi:hypothetical protein